MQVLTPSDDRRLGGASVVTIGAFDGVHLGHQAVIAELRRRADALGCASAVVTFDRHPASIVRPDSAPKLLNDIDQKLELLAQTGVDATYVVPFDAARASETAEEFVEEVIVGSLDAREVVVGEDFHFGAGRRGDVALLAKMGESHRFVVEGLALVGLDPAKPDGQKVSSTAIRAMLGRGDVGGAASLLGRIHEVRGTVMPGDRRGRELGFHSENVGVPEEICLPSDGIYAGWYERPDGSVLPTAISLGRRPTFYEAQAQSLLEAHVIDFVGDLYTEPARVRFVERLRGEEKFASIEALVAQMRVDVDNARKVLGVDS